MTIKREKLLAAAILGLLLGVGMLYQEAHWRALGKDAYLNQQALRFDRFYQPHAIGMLIAAFAATFIVVGIYESLVKSFTKFLAKS
jgi:hypothetical protein